MKNELRVDIRVRVFGEVSKEYAELKEFLNSSVAHVEFESMGEAASVKHQLIEQIPDLVNTYGTDNFVLMVEAWDIRDVVEVLIDQYDIKGKKYINF